MERFVVIYSDPGLDFERVDAVDIDHAFRAATTSGREVLAVLQEAIYQRLVGNAVGLGMDLRGAR